MLWAVVMFTLPASAQISRISGTVSDEFGILAAPYGSRAAIVECGLFNQYYAFGDG